VGRTKLCVAIGTIFRWFSIGSGTDIIHFANNWILPTYMAHDTLLDALLSTGTHTSMSFRSEPGTNRAAGLKLIRTLHVQPTQMHAQ
jgi:hypothetical protein